MSKFKIRKAEAFIIENVFKRSGILFYIFIDLYVVEKFQLN